MKSLEKAGAGRLRRNVFGWWERPGKSLRRSFDRLDEDSDFRRENRETDKYNHPVILGIAVCALIGVIYAAAESLTPPTDIAVQIRNEPENFLTYKSGHVSFGHPASPPMGRLGGTPIELPERNLTRLPGFDPSNFWYEFEFEVPPGRFTLNRTGLLIPKIWGQAEVYINGLAADFGLNQRPILPLREAKNRVQIHVAAESPFKYGIRATYPIVVADINLLRDLENTLNAQALTPLRLLIVQLVIGALFLGIFIVLPRKPELLTFVGFTLVNVFYSYFLMKREVTGLLILKSWKAQEIAVLLLDTLRSYLLFRFSLEFFRLASPRIARLNRLALVLLVPICLAFWRLFTALAPTASPWTLMHLTEQAYFLACTVGVSIWVCSYLLFHLKHRPRAILGLVVLTGIAYTFGANIFDFWFVQEKITGEYRNQLLTYFLMAAITTIEFARTERDKSELASNLPREQREKFLRKFGKFKHLHEGFVLLVDGVGFSSLQESVPLDQQGALSDRINSHLLGLAARIPGASVLNGTGDGYYFAWEGASAQPLFDEILALAVEITSQPLEIGLDGQEPGELRFRCAIGHGSYFVGVSRNEGLMKDYSAGRLLTSLARIIGGGGGVRILRTAGAEALLKPGGFTAGELKGKHGARFEYLEVDGPESRQGKASA